MGTPTAPGWPLVSPGVGTVAEWFARCTATLHGLLPTRGPLGVLGRRTSPTLIGFLLLSAVGFGVDLAGLHVAGSVLGLAFPVAVTIGYALASLVNFVTNKALNFRSHGHVGGQSGRWVVIAASNYLLWILGLAWLLDRVGVPALLARTLAGAVEVAWLYSLSRLWVFRAAPPRPDAERRGP